MKKNDQEVKKPKKKKTIFFIRKTVTQEVEFGEREATEAELKKLEEAPDQIIVNKTVDKKTLKRQKKIAKAQKKVAKNQKKAEAKKKPKTKTRKKNSKPPSPKKIAKKELLDKKDLKEKKVKEPKEPGLAVKEFPVKMVKEVSKVRWSTNQNLLIKFVQVIIFILVFAALFYLIDLGFQELFTVMHVI